MSSDQPKLCIHCQHFTGSVKFPRCREPNLMTQNAVTGAPVDNNCYPERKDGTKCGPEGKLFATSMRVAA